MKNCFVNGGRERKKALDYSQCPNLSKCLKIRDMKSDELMESIYGCLDRIESKINSLSVSQSESNVSEPNNIVNEESLQELKQDLNTVKTEFKRASDGLTSIKNDTVNLLNRVFTPDKFVEALFSLRNEYRQSWKQQTDSSDKIMVMMADMKTRQTQETEELKLLLRATDENIKGGIYNENRHSFSIESPFIFWGFSGMFAAIVVLAVALYFAKQPGYDRMDNDLKYRYIKMKGEASPKQIGDLENIFELNRDNNKIRQILKDVEAYEDAVRKWAPLPNKPASKNRLQRNRKTRQSSSRTSPFNRTNLKSEL